MQDKIDKKSKWVCNCCGEEYWEATDISPVYIVDSVGYGSEWDFYNIELRLCSKCADKFLGYMVKNFKKNPLIMPSWMEAEAESDE